MKNILLTVLAIFIHLTAQGAVGPLINGNQINPKTAISISTLTVTGATGITASSITSASNVNLDLKASAGPTLVISTGPYGTANFNSRFVISGGSLPYIDYLLEIEGWNNGSTQDAGILLQTQAGGGSPFIDFTNSDGKGRIGRNPPNSGGALFVGNGGGLGDALQIGSRDATSVQFFTNDNAWEQIDPVGNVMFGYGVTMGTYTNTGSFIVPYSVTAASITVGASQLGSIGIGLPASATYPLRVFGPNNSTLAAIGDSNNQLNITSANNNEIVISNNSSGNILSLGDQSTTRAITISGSNVAIPAGQFTVGGSSFSIAGGSATVAYNLTAGNITSTGQQVVLGTSTVVGTAFSVGGSNFSVGGGSATVKYSMTSGNGNFLSSTGFTVLSANTQLNAGSGYLEIHPTGTLYLRSTATNPVTINDNTGQDTLLNSGGSGAVRLGTASGTQVFRCTAATGGGTTVITNTICYGSCVTPCTASTGTGVYLP